MRPIRVVVVTFLVVVAGCSAPIADQRDSSGRFEDPATDVEGWEDGYWANESLPVTTDDGLNATERGAVVARAMARVERVREVEFRRPVDVDVVTREEFASGSVATSDGTSAESLYRDVRYEALFLLGDGTDGGEATRRNDRRTVQGYYDPGSDRVVLITETETPRIDEGVLAQELFHAYQFRHLIPRRIPALGTYDGRQAVLSVVEGDANLVQYRYERRCGAAWSCVSTAASGSGGDGDGGGSGGLQFGLYLLQYFPYAEGEQYVREVQERAGWEGVDALYEDFPTTTASVIHRDELEAEAVELPGGATGGWRAVDRRNGGDYATIGEAGLAGMFAYTLYDDRESTLVERSSFLNLRAGNLSDTNPLDYGLEPSTGWRGDRIRVYRDGDGRTGYVWRIRFANESAASGFLSRYRELLRYRGAERVSDGQWRIAEGRFADAFALDREGAVVTLVNAPTLADLDRIHPGR